MTERTDEKPTQDDNTSRLSADPMTVVQAGLDDGYAYTKVALADGRLFSAPSRARIGSAGVTWIRDQEQRIFEYETGGTVYSVGAVDGEANPLSQLAHWQPGDPRHDFESDPRPDMEGAEDYAGADVAQ